MGSDLDTGLLAVLGSVLRIVLAVAFATVLLFCLASCRSKQETTAGIGEAMPTDFRQC